MCDSDHDDSGHGHSHGNSEPTIHTNMELYKKLSTIYYTLESKGLVIKDAGYSKTKGRVEFSRGKDLIKYFQDNINEVVEELNKIGDYKLDKSNKNILIQVFQM